MKTLLLLIAAGIISTLAMDISGAILRAIGFTAGAPPELVGKWIQSAIRGHVFVGDIRTSVGQPVPLRQFLLYHYIIGVMLTFLFYFIISLFRITPLPWWMPLLYGLTTTLIPVFLMFPGMGFGIMGLKRACWIPFIAHCRSKSFILWYWINSDFPMALKIKVYRLYS
jgi:Protein of unknown function (DUF2938).